jgi:hypothetical protein
MNRVFTCIYVDSVLSSSVKSEVAWPGKVLPFYMCLKTEEYGRNRGPAEEGRAAERRQVL